MSALTYRREAEKRQAKFVQAVKESEKPLRVVATDKESRKYGVDQIKQWGDEILENAFLIDKDLLVKDAVIRMIAADHPKIDIDAYFVRAIGAHPITDEEQAVIYQRNMREIEAEEKRIAALKKAAQVVGDLPGQVKLNFEPAEAASPVTTRKLEPGE